MAVITLSEKPSSAEVVASCVDFQIVSEKGRTKIVWPTDEKTPVRLTRFGTGVPGSDGPTDAY